MIKLRDLLWEVGEGSSEPFKYKKLNVERGPGGFEYDIFAEAHGEKLTIRLFGYIEDWRWFITGVPEQDIVNMEREFNLSVSDPAINDVKFLYIAFGIRVASKKGQDDDQDFPLVNDKTYMFRLMATLKQILMPFIDQNNINIVFYNPSKREKEKDIASTEVGRSKLYDIFIRSSFPGAKSINSVSNERPFVYTLIRPVTES
jgi:hypothetical protein